MSHNVNAGQTILQPERIRQRGRQGFWTSYLPTTAQIIPSPTEKWKDWPKLVLNKSSNEWLSLLSYRGTPLHHGYTAAQLSMGLCHPDELKLQALDYEHIRRKKEETIKFDYYHRRFDSDLKAEGP